MARGVKKASGRATMRISWWLGLRRSYVCMCILGFIGFGGDDVERGEALRAAS